MIKKLFQSLITIFLFTICISTISYSSNDFTEKECKDLENAIVEYYMTYGEKAFLDMFYTDLNVRNFMRSSSCSSQRISAELRLGVSFNDNEMFYIEKAFSCRHLNIPSRGFGKVYIGYAYQNGVKTLHARGVDEHGDILEYSLAKNEKGENVGYFNNPSFYFEPYLVYQIINYKVSDVLLVKKDTLSEFINDNILIYNPSEHSNKNEKISDDDFKRIFKQDKLSWIIEKEKKSIQIVLDYWKKHNSKL